jgi:serine/threonine-protein kinase
MAADETLRSGGAPRSERDVETVTILPGDVAAAPVLVRKTAVTLGAEGTAGGAPAGGLVLPDRYEDVRLLGRGGFGEVRLVVDRALERTVAMKILRPEALAPEIRARFLAEIKLTASLHHPGIVPVHDHGELPDGRLWFTMAEVRGRTLHAVLDDVFAGGGRPPGVARRRLLDVFARVCDAVAYAHSHGVIHRDLKPDNVMVGDFGRVLVMDWGIARRTGAPESMHAPPSSGDHTPAGDGLTRYGTVLGTPAYMAPEQARGDVERHGPATDVYALGAILYHVLSGRPPYTATGPGAWRRVLAGPPEPLSPLDAPPDLAAICERAMAREPERRYPDAGPLAADVEAFLGGAQRRERALAELAKAAARAPEITRLRAQAEALREEAKQRLEPVRPFDPVEAKLPGWEREDEAARLAREAALAETRWTQAVHGALAIDPDLPEAHAALADHYRERLGDAELAHREEDAARFEVLLRAHDRGRHAAFLSGMGALTLVTDPPGARVTLYRHEAQRRRLVPVRVDEIGPTPIVDRQLPRGSYLLRIRAPGRAEVAYPVLIERAACWDGVPPGASAPYPIPLPPAGAIGPGEVYVPAGWCWTGGDPVAMDALPRRRVWIDGFVLGRHPVTHAEYLAFLNDLLDAGREDEALAACPRQPRSHSETAADMVYARDAAGRFVLAEGGDALLAWPVVLVDWHGASAYARRRAETTGLPYRLPDELEREKAARSADARLFPWGNHFDATWACVIDSHAGDPARVSVDRYPLDESPYGARGLAGNVRDWCANPWTREGPEIEGGRLRLVPAAPRDPSLRAVRGGAWKSLADLSRSAARFAARPGQRWTTTGLRLARSLGS